MDNCYKKLPYLALPCKQLFVGMKHSRHIIFPMHIFQSFLTENNIGKVVYSKELHINNLSRQ